MATNGTRDNRSDDPVGINGVAKVETDSTGSTAPRYRIPNANAALTIYNRMRDAHGKRCRTFARIQGMIDGNPPYPKTETNKIGAMARSNFNPRDGEAILEQISLAYWSLFNDTKNIVEIETNFADPPSQNDDFAQIVADEFTKFMRDWDRFSEVMSTHQQEFITYGTNALVWVDENDWQFDTIDIFSFLVPQKSRNSVEAFTMVMVEHTMEASELFDIYENATGDKWNKKAIEDILVYTSNIDSDKKLYTGQSFAEMQTKTRNGDSDIEDYYNEDIRMVTVFIKEFSGKISRGIFHPTMLGDTPQGAGTDWPFFFHNQYDKMAHAVMPVTFTQGAKFFHGNKGLGHKMFNTVEATTRLDNSLMDGAARASTVVIKSRQGRNKDIKPIVFEHGGYVDIGEAEFAQNLMGSNLSSNVEVARYFRSKFEYNNNISGTNPGTPDGKVRSANEVRVQVTKEARVQKNKTAHYYEYLDKLFSEVMRKVLKCKQGHKNYDQVKQFIKRCVDKGVPEEFFALTKANTAPNGLPSHLQVRAARVSGSGSQMADQIESQSVMNILPTLGQRGRQNALKDYVSSHRGWRYIDRYLPPEDQSNEPQADDTLSSIENNQLEKGEMVVVSPDNKHAIHAPRHLERLKQLAKAFDEATNGAREAGSNTPMVDAGQFGQYGLNEIDIAFQTIGPHFVRHLMYLGQDTTQKDLANSLNAQWAGLANFGDMIANNAQAARDAELRATRKQETELDALPAEEKVKMAKVQGELRLKEAKLLGEMDRASKRDQLEFLLQRSRVNFENEVKRSKAINDMAVKAAKEMQSASESVSGKEEGDRFA